MDVSTDTSEVCPTRVGVDSKFRPNRPSEGDGTTIDPSLCVRTFYYRWSCRHYWADRVETTPKGQMFFVSEPENC